jgi:subtilisin family serine protease
MKSITRQFAISAALALVQFCGVYAAEPVGPAAAPVTTVNTEKNIMVLFSPAEASTATGTSRSTSYRNRTGYYTRGTDHRLAEDLGRDHRLDLVTDWPITELDLVCAVLSIPDGRTVDEVIAALEQDSRLQLVQEMQSFEAMDGGDPYYPLQVRQYSIDLEKLHQVSTGNRISIAIIDTGVDLQHVDLTGQFELTRNFAEDYSADFSGDRHGTAVAGIIAAKSHNDEGMVGIAPDARLLALKACWPLTPGDMASTCNTLTLALALNRAMMEEVSIINMSLAGPEDRIIGLLLRRAIEKGILIVAADAAKAGDERFPASLAGVVAVSAMSAPAAEAVQAPLPSAPDAGKGAMIAAPGIGVLATAPGNSYDFFSGNSFAAAHVSGLAALLIQQCGKPGHDSLQQNLQLISRHLQAGDMVESLSCHASEQFR